MNLIAPEATRLARSLLIKSTLALSLTWAACFSLPGLAAQSNASSIQASSLAPMAKLSQDSKALQPLTQDDLKVLVAKGTKLLDAQIGDLTGQGKSAALVVLDHPASDSSAEGAHSRTLLLVARDAQGQLQTLAQNDKIVPCARCGGAAGDPYSYSRVEPGRFTVVTEGGSREHWWNEFHFKYSPTINGWVLQKVVRGVTDTATGRRKKINLSARSLSAVTFSDFDPFLLPQVKLK